MARYLTNGDLAFMISLRQIQSTTPYILKKAKFLIIN
jgi:hypothetical protein